MLLYEFCAIVKFSTNANSKYLHEFPISNGTKVLLHDHQRRTRIEWRGKCGELQSDRSARFIIYGLCISLFLSLSLSNFISFNIITRTSVSWTSYTHDFAPAWTWIAERHKHVLLYKPNLQLCNFMYCTK